MAYKVLIVDDEEPARDLMASYAKKIAELEVVGVLSDALSAKRLIDAGDVDILLSDIQMDDLTGIDLVKTLKVAPITIFTTAYSEYALESYNLDVVDYLVKPISFQRFCKAIDKAIELMQFKQQSDEQSSLSDPVLSRTAVSNFFFVKTNRKMVKVEHANLLFIESYGEYVKLYTHDDIILALQTMAFMEDLLPSNDFIRIHRSHIVNLNHIEEIEGNLVRIGEHQLSISKRMKEQFMSMIQRKGLI